MLRNLSAATESFVVYFNFCIPVRSFENQGGPYQDDNYLPSSRKDQRNWVTVKTEISKYPYVG